MSALLWLGLSPLVAIIATVTLMMVLLLTANQHLLRGSGEPHDGPLFVLPRGWVMFIGFLCFVMFLAEGSMLDWSALFLTTLHGMDPSQAGMGYAVFAVAMTLGRLNGISCQRIGPIQGIIKREPVCRAWDYHCD